MTHHRLRSTRLSPLALLVAMLALVALTTSGVAVANSRHHEGAAGRTSEPTNLSDAKDDVRAFYGDTVDATQPAGYTHQASPTSDYAKRRSTESSTARRSTSSGTATPATGRSCSTSTTRRC